MNKLIAILALIAAPAMSAEVYITTPGDLYPSGYVVLDAPGIVRFNNIVDPAYWHLASGDGQLYYELKDVQIPSYPFHAIRSTLTGGQCNSACSFSFKEKLTQPSCPGDGGNLTYPDLVFTLGGVEFYREPTRTVTAECYVTPAPLAVKSWVAPVLTFTNPSQDRQAASTLFTLTDANYLYSEHVFTITGNVTCSALLKNVGNTRVKRWREVGFQCTANLEPGEVATVVVQ